MPAPAPKPFGKYTLIRELGRGGMGIVYLARDEELKRDVALKMLLGAAQAREEEIERLKREAQAAARLRHPNILQVYEVGTIQGRTYFTMEFVSGRTLDWVWREMDVRRRLEVVRDVAIALDFAHRAGVVHRDIKPSNIMVAPDGRVCLMDFGLAKHVEDTKNLTVTGAVMGTPNFMSPEQACGRGDLIDGRSDVFSLGSVLYWLFAGKSPFERDDAIRTLAAVVQDEPKRPPAANPEMPRDVETICGKALQKLRGRRYQTAGDLAADLERFLSGAPIHARPPGPLDRALGWARRHPVPLASAALALAALGTGGGLWLSGRSKADAANRRLAEESAAGARRTEAGKWLQAGREKMDLAERCMMAGRAADLKAALRDAEAAFGKAIEADGAGAEGWAGRGRARRLAGDGAGALADLDRAVALGPELAAGWHERGLLRLVEFVQRRSAAAPESANARRARELQVAAADDFVHAAALDPGPGREWVPLEARASLAFLAGEFRDALRDLDAVIEKNPFVDDALVLRATIRLIGSSPDPVRAREDLDRAVQANAFNAAAFNLRGVARRAVGDAAGARADYDAALTLAPGLAAALVNRAGLRLEAHDPAGAAADLDTVLRGEPDNLPALRGRGEAALALSDWTRADGLFTAALALLPSDPFLLARRSLARRFAGKTADARADAEAALASRDPAVLVEARLSRAALRQEGGDAAGALADFDEAVALAPGNADALFGRALCLDALGRTGESREALRRFLDACPGDPRRVEVERRLAPR